MVEEAGCLLGCLSPGTRGWHERYGMRPEQVLGLLQAGEKLCGSVGWEATEGEKKM